MSEISNNKMIGWGHSHPLFPLRDHCHALLWTFCGLAFLLCAITIGQRKFKQFPCVNYNWWEITYRQAKQRYLKDAKRLLRQGAENFDGPFYVITDFGPLIIMPHSSLDAMDKEPCLDFRAFAARENLSELDTFKVFRDPVRHLTEDAVKRGLTRSLSRFTAQLSAEAAGYLVESWGECSEWTRVDVRHMARMMIARLSASVFLGPDLARNKDWLRISVDFTIAANEAVQAVRLWPGPLRAIAAKYLPICRRFRAEIENASQILGPTLKHKYIDDTEDSEEAQGDDNSVKWFLLAAKGRQYSDLDAQLGLTIGAIHTTSDLLTEAIIQLCAHPEILKPLREEASLAVAKYGWQSATLRDLRLLDSFIKETQRLKPIAMITMQRVALENVVLEDGTKLKRGDTMAVSSHHMWESASFHEPHKFDAFRFANIDTTGAKKQLFVAINQSSLGFGYGKHACPGRFFVANEVKVALVHILLSYDLRLAKGLSPCTREYGFLMMSDPNAHVEVRKRG